MRTNNKFNLNLGRFSFMGGEYCYHCACAIPAPLDSKFLPLTLREGKKVAGFYENNIQAKNKNKKNKEKQKIQDVPTPPPYKPLPLPTGGLLKSNGCRIMQSTNTSFQKKLFKEDPEECAFGKHVNYRLLDYRLFKK